MIYYTDNAYSHGFVCVMLACIILVACSSTNDKAATQVALPPPAPAKPFTSIVMDTVKGSISGAWQAVQSPLEDVNIKRKPIPERLQQINNPYLIPSPLNCSVLTSEILTLNMMLGPDSVIVSQGTLPSSWHEIHMPSWQDKDKYVQQGSNLIQEKAADTVQSKVNIIPYRNWVRQLSGADAHAKKLSQAYEAGKSRRSFLKGLSLGMHCQYVEY